MDYSSIPLENKIENLKDIVSHKQVFLESCKKMSIYLLKHNNDKMALELMKRAFTHDISKLYDDEFFEMSKVVYNKSSLKDASNEIPKEKEDVIKTHWRQNPHHPEFWDNVYQMSELDIIEMVCDWHSRSIQYRTNLLDFFEERQIKRFKFPEDFYNKVKKYCKILASL